MGLTFRNLVLLSALAILPVIAAGQSPAGASSQAHAGGSNAVRADSLPFEWGVQAQGGFGVTEDRGNFKFFMAGLHAGKVLTGNVGPGWLRGNFEYAMELWPLWQSYMPTFQRQNCAPITGSPGLINCSAPFHVGGTYTGVSFTPSILRWNFAGTHRFAPWVQGAGGLLWTNHKYPAVGGPPVNSGGVTNSSPGENTANIDTSVWNFTPQFGVGVHYFVAPRRSVDFGANAIHISSASLGDKNPGVNASVQFSLGYTWWK